MAQAIRERPQTAVEMDEKSDDRTVASVAVNGGAKAKGNLSATAEAAQAHGNGHISSAAAGEKKNRIQVSNTKKPLFFYLNLAKRYIKQYNDVELSALGMGILLSYLFAAIPTVVTIAEILKANGVAVEKKVLTSTVGSKDESKGRLVQKAKIEIVLEKNHASKGSEETQSDEDAKEKEV